MKLATEKLNRVKNAVVELANREGINLQEEFGTPDKFKQWVVALTFKTLTDAGVPTNEAFDMVFGEGEYEALAARTWEAAQNS